MRDTAILLMGPTASGKSALALELAEHFPVELVSVDSAQVYRGMDIGTAKPDPLTRAQVPHHLIDLLWPTEAYSAARFRADALAAMGDIIRRGRIPLLVGGTMLYFKALREGLSRLPEADPVVRARIEDEARLRGWAALHGELARVDAPTAQRLQPTDAQRIQRALEVWRLTGSPMSGLLGREADSGGAAPRYRYLALALMPGDRAVLHSRIAQRFDAMLAGGLVEELQALRARHALRADLPSMRCVGYRQAWAHLEGEYDRRELRERGIFATRQLAKRQLTWLRQTQARTFDSLAGSVLREVREVVDAALVAAG
jgi:tRNA dimethylallyltransferase